MQDRIPINLLPGYPEGALLYTAILKALDLNKHGRVAKYHDSNILPWGVLANRYIKYLAHKYLTSRLHSNNKSISRRIIDIAIDDLQPDNDSIAITTKQHSITIDHNLAIEVPPDAYHAYQYLAFSGNYDWEPLLAADTSYSHKIPFSIRFEKDPSIIIDHPRPTRKNQKQPATKSDYHRIGVYL